MEEIFLDIQILCVNINIKLEIALSNSAKFTFQKTNLEPDVLVARSKSIEFNFFPIS